jgi:hypothetical protein
VKVFLLNWNAAMSLSINLDYAVEKPESCFKQFAVQISLSTS